MINNTEFSFAVNRNTSNAPYFDIVLPDKKVERVRFFADKHLFERSINSKEFLSKLNIICDLPTVLSPIIIYPDVEVKKWGFPSGLLFRTGEGNPYVYPLAIPDFGCGYSVNLINLSIHDFSEKEKKELFYNLTRSIGLNSTSRKRFSYLDIVGVLENGMNYISSVPELKGNNFSSDKSGFLNWQPSTTNFTGDLLEECLDFLGGAAGHYVEIRVVNEILDETSCQEAGISLGQLILIVHLGSQPLKDYLYLSFGEKMAIYNLEQEDIKEEYILDGFFGVPAESDLGIDYLQSSMSALNYSFVNRELVKFNVLSTLQHVLPSKSKNISFLSLEHNHHETIDKIFNLQGNSILQFRRGIQPINHLQPFAFIGGGSHVDAYLVKAGANIKSFEGFCGHGTPEWDVNTENIAAKEPPLNDVFSNLEFNRNQYIKDTYNLEITQKYIEESGMVKPVARLRPFINYQDPKTKLKLQANS